jgi:YgiT-type zinc finger domain-containing protein
MTKKRSCEKCGSQNLKATRVTYPVNLAEKQINIGRVSVRQCQDCSAIMPTDAGKEKIARNMLVMFELLGS